MIDSYVSGSTGFIGARLCAKLEGHVEGIPFGQLSSYNFQDHRRFFWLSTYGNLAGQDNPYRIWQSNVYDVVQVLDRLMFKKDLAHFLFVSTSSVLLPVQTPYSRSKRAIEEILMAMNEFPSCIVRPYSVFGRDEQPQHLIPKLIRSCVSGQEMEFIPWPIHDWISVDDVVDGLILLSQKEAKGIFELGTGTGRTNQDVLEIVENVTGKKANLKYVTNMRSYDTRRWVCEKSAATELGWIPNREFYTTIQEMVDSYVASMSGVQ